MMYYRIQWTCTLTGTTVIGDCKYHDYEFAITMENFYNNFYKNLFKHTILTFGSP